MSDQEDKPKKRPVRASKSSSKKKKATKEKKAPKKTKSGKPSKLEVSKKALKAYTKTKFYKGAIADDALTELSYYAKSQNLNKEQVVKIMVEAMKYVNGRKAVRILKKDIEKAIGEEKRKSIEY